MWRGNKDIWFLLVKFPGGCNVCSSCLTSHCVVHHSVKWTCDWIYWTFIVTTSLRGKSGSFDSEEGNNSKHWEVFSSTLFSNCMRPLCMVFVCVPVVCIIHRIYIFFIMMTEFHSPVQTRSELLGMKTIWRATEQLLYFFVSLAPILSHQSAFQPFPVFWLVKVTHQNNTDIQTCLMAMQKESIPYFKQLLYKKEWIYTHILM